MAESSIQAHGQDQEKRFQEPGRQIFRILSIDGGGVKGIIPAIVLQFIEEHTGRKIHEMFDLIAGTSVGGLIAAALTVQSPNDKTQPKFSAQDAVAILENYSDDIFPSNNLFGKLCQTFGIAKHSPLPFESILKEKFGDACLSDTLTELLIPAFELEVGERYFFRTSDVRIPKAHQESALNSVSSPPFKKIKISKEEMDFPLWQVCRSTTSAPTFYPPFHLPFLPGKHGEQKMKTIYQKKLEKLDKKHLIMGIWPLFQEVPDEKNDLVMIDGGVFANNPAMCAIAEAKKTDFSERIRSPHDLFVVSLGTGTQPTGFRIPNDIVGWTSALVDISLNASQGAINMQLETILPQDHYYRFDIELDHVGMDDGSPENIQKLKKVANDLIEKDKHRLVELCKFLKEPRTTPPNKDPHACFQNWSQINTSGNILIPKLDIPDDNENINYKH